MNIKRGFNLMVVMAMLLATFASSQSVDAAPSEKPVYRAPIQLDADREEGEIVVAMSDSSDKTLSEVVAQAFDTASKNDAQLTRLTLDGGMVIKVDDSELASTIAELNNDPDVLYAEPNYVYSIPAPASVSEGYRPNSEYVFRRVEPSAATNWKSIMAVPEENLRAMKTGSGANAKSVYPTDLLLFDNEGWTTVQADLVWTNTTASKGVCVIDTGVNKLHKDLANKVLAGYDFVWGDTVPDDDHGHGTHVAGVIAAVQNNKMGIAGVSTGKIVPVKALDVQGYGTSFDIAAAIQYCGNRADISVINLSLGSNSPSTTIHTALEYALLTKGKLAVAAAGNDGNSDRDYPAGYSDEVVFVNKLLAVGASGFDDGINIDYECRAGYSNYGSWVSVVAPGTNILSTTPWDISFYLNFHDGVDTRFGYLSGTSQATPFVAAAAARYWGYQPASTNAVVGAALTDVNKGTPLIAGGSCWPAEMNGKAQVNVAKLLDRGGLIAGVFDAVMGTPLTGATISAYQGNTKVGTGLISAVTYKDLFDIDPTRIYMYQQPTIDIINLPASGAGIDLRVNKAGYTVGDQPAFRHEAAVDVVAGEMGVITDTGVPPIGNKSFNMVVIWKVWNQFGVEADPTKKLDLDMDVWLPGTPNPLDINQPATFIVGLQSDDYSFNVGDPYGSMTGFPYARIMREGGYTDDVRVETIVIRNRFQAHAPLAANIYLPYYPSDYSVFVTDYGQTIDHDDDGCGDNYGTDYSGSYDNTCGGSGTPGISLMGAYLTPSVYVWKDGKIQFFVDLADHDGDGASDGPWGADTACNEVWWKALTLSSGVSGSIPTYTGYNGICDDGTGGGFHPYNYDEQPGVSINENSK